MGTIHCGFASSFAANRLIEDDQWRKRELIVSTAEEVWDDRLRRPAERVLSTRRRLP